MRLFGAVVMTMPASSEGRDLDQCPPAMRMSFHGRDEPGHAKRIIFNASRLFSLVPLKTQPLRSHALDLFIERVVLLVAVRRFRLARIRFAQLAEGFLDRKFFAVGHDAIPDRGTRYASCLISTLP
jgi:hypothetical protein